ncbi:hypothetical protein EV421DRAFT_188457 [Armillaria borealis]|uniref:Uncharacterized protein n=1 Tax=Armillaria borealis TaxID=47425 RepID=A0AA39JQR6_9AGAR|nr:hypothetical protein EV421DRAFT_188457 [Armillaria borealis]
MGHSTTEELRQTLRLHSTSVQFLHSYQHHDSMKLPKTSARTSAFLDPSMSDANFPPATTPHQGPRRRVANAATDVITDIRNGVVTDSHGNVFDLWSLRLSTEDKLISPRPLGATHILVIVDASEVPETVSRNRTAVPTLSVQMPINDLLFKLSAPNLSKEPKLPRRIHQELPRVGIRVPHIEMFCILVIYVHTRNRIEMMRAALPQWIGDIMQQKLTTYRLAVPAHVELKEKKRGKLLRRLSRGSMSAGSFPEPPTPERKRLLDEASGEIAEASRENDAFGRDLVEAAARLNALRDNLTFIGFYEKSLWAELNDCSGVLVRAIRLNSRVGR